MRITSLNTKGLSTNRVDNSLVVPVVIENTPKGERNWDIFSRLLKDRVIMVTGEVNEVMENVVVAQLLFLNSEDDKKPIHMYINSPGGAVVDGMAIIDTMNYIDAPVYTYCTGMCASMGAMMLSQGERGHRYCLPNAEVMIHQPLGGAQGQATDINITAKQINKTKTKLLKMLSEACNQDYDKIYNDCERDYYMDAEEALEYGIVDVVLNKKKR